MRGLFFILLSVLSLSELVLAYSPIGTRARLPSKLPDISEKLVYDTKTGRFFEQDMDLVCEEEFCLIDDDTNEPILLTREEKERIFLDALQSFYVNGKSNLPNDQFDRLKEDLSWEGSALVQLNRDEVKFLDAKIAYSKGTPILSDKDFDALKATLMDSGSKIAVQTNPECYVDTGVCKVTWLEDKLLTSSLYVPAGLMSTLIFIGVTFEIANALLHVAVNPLLLLAAATAPVSIISKELTNNFLFSDPLVASGPCPKCSVVNKVFFGDVLLVEGDKDQSTIKCTNCKELMTIKRSTLRVSTLATPKGPAPAAPKPAPKPAPASS